MLSLLLALMLVPGSGFVAAAVSQTVLGQPGDGIAASNQLFERFSRRAGPLRCLEATTRLADNWARVEGLAEARVIRDGKQEPVRSGNLVVALFQHDTSRALDPQAHVHAIIANATRAPDGSWRALHNEALWKAYTASASVYNATLRASVERLGYRGGRAARRLRRARWR